MIGFNKKNKELLFDEDNCVGLENVLSIDLETSGIYEDKHGILSIGAVVVKEDPSLNGYNFNLNKKMKEVMEKMRAGEDFFQNYYFFYGMCNLREDAEVDAEAMKINQIDLNIKRSLSEEELIKEFKKWYSKWKGNYIQMGQNPMTVDWPFLRRAFREHRVEFDLHYRTENLFNNFRNSFIKTHLFKEKQCLPMKIKKDKSGKIIGKEPVGGVDDIMKYTGLNHKKIPKEIIRHHALGDAIIEAEAYQRIKHGKYLFDIFGKQKIPGYLRK